VTHMFHLCNGTFFWHAVRDSLQNTITESKRYVERELLPRPSGAWEEIALHEWNHNFFPGTYFQRLPTYGRQNARHWIGKCSEAKTKQSSVIVIKQNFVIKATPDEFALSFKQHRTSLHCHLSNTGRVCVQCC
jgi:hypothetical protein